MFTKISRLQQAPSAMIEQALILICWNLDLKIIQTSIERSKFSSADQVKISLCFFLITAINLEPKEPLMVYSLFIWFGCCRLHTRKQCNPTFLIITICLQQLIRKPKQPNTPFHYIFSLSVENRTTSNSNLFLYFCTQLLRILFSTSTRLFFSID